MTQMKETMDVVGYFMKLEDKYWGLFLISLLVLFFLLKKQEKFVVGYGILAYAFLLCPMTVYALTRMFDKLDIYYPIRWICQTPIFICLAVTLFISFVKENNVKIKSMFVAAILILIVFFAGNPVFMEGNRISNHRLGIEKEYIESYDMIKQDMIKKGNNSASIWGPKEWMAASRAYDACFYPIYGKDIWDSSTLIPSAEYSQEKQQLYDFYSYYESPESPLINKDEQLNALADSLKNSTEVKSAYIIVYKNNDSFIVQKQKKDILTEDDQAAILPDMKSMFTNKGYQLTGETNNYLIFCITQI